MDQFNVAAQEELSRQSVGVRPGSVLVPVSNYHALYHLQAVLDRIRTDRRDIVVMHVRLLRRSTCGIERLEAEQLFGSVEQFLFTKALSLAEKRGKPIRLAVVSANDLWGGILNAAVKLEASTIVLGRSAKVSLTEEAREIGLAWEQLPDPAPEIQPGNFHAGRARANSSCSGRTRRNSLPTKCAWCIASGCASAIWCHRTNCTITTWSTSPSTK